MKLRPRPATAIAANAPNPSTRATRRSTHGRLTRHAASTHNSSTAIGQNQTIDGADACHSPPEIALDRPSTRIGIRHVPTNDAPGFSATVASACSRPSCQPYSCPPPTESHFGGVRDPSPAGGFNANRVWFRYHIAELWLTSTPEPENRK